MIIGFYLIVFRYFCGQTVFFIVNIMMRFSLYINIRIVKNFRSQFVGHMPFGFWPSLPVGYKIHYFIFKSLFLTRKLNLLLH